MSDNRPDILPAFIPRTETSWYFTMIRKKTNAFVGTIFIVKQYQILMGTAGQSLAPFSSQNLSNCICRTVSASSTCGQLKSHKQLPVIGTDLKIIDTNIFSGSGFNPNLVVPPLRGERKQIKEFISFKFNLTFQHLTYSKSQPQNYTNYTAIII